MRGSGNKQQQLEWLLLHVMGDLKQMQTLHKQLLPSLHTNSGWVFAGNLSALQSGLISCTTTENPRYSRLCLSVKTVTGSKWNDRNSSVTNSFGHRAGAAHGELSTAEGSHANAPGAPCQPHHGPAVATGEQHLPAGALWPQLRALINLPQRHH